MSTARHSIMIVEDNPSDYQAVARVFKKLGVEADLRHCATGMCALDELRGSAPPPDMILLDLNMPGLDGREVLKEIKSDEALKSIPVIVFTTSDSPHDIADCYQAGANSYITKPVDLQKLTETLSTLYQYWLKIATLPDEDDIHPTRTSAGAQKI